MDAWVLVSAGTVMYYFFRYAAMCDPVTMAFMMM